MNINIKISNRKSLSRIELFEMFKLRARVFKDRMGWEIPVLDGMEVDGYDAMDPDYMLIRTNKGVLCGCWRIMPTNGPYMLKNSFSELLYGGIAPSASNILELSRFAIELKDSENFKFSNVTLESIKEIIRYGEKEGISEYVTVTTTAIERLLSRTGIVTSRFGPPLRIGVENTVALHVNVSASFKALFNELEAAA